MNLLKYSYLDSNSPKLIKDFRHYMDLASSCITQMKNSRWLVLVDSHDWQEDSAAEWRQAQGEMVAAMSRVAKITHELGG